MARGRAPAYDCEKINGSAADRLLKQSGAIQDEKLLERSEFEELVQRGAIEGARRALARLDGDRSRSHFDDLFNPTRPPPSPFPKLIAQFVAMKAEEGGVRKQDPKNLDKQRANAALIEKILGGDTLVRDVKYDACRNAVALLARPIEPDKKI